MKRRQYHCIEAHLTVCGDEAGGHGTNRRIASESQRAYCLSPKGTLVSCYSIKPVPCCYDELVVRLCEPTLDLPCLRASMATAMYEHHHGKTAQHEATRCRLRHRAEKEIIEGYVNSGRLAEFTR